MPSQNPFLNLVVEDEDPEDDSLVSVTTTKKEVAASAPPVQKQGGRKSAKSIPGDKPKADTREGTDGGYEGDTRGRGGRGRGGRGRGGRNNKDHRSKRGQTKPDEKRQGHGAGNWGSTEEAITDAEKADVKADVPPSDTPVEEEVEEEAATMTYEEHLKLKAEARSKLPSTSIRKAGEDDGGAGYKVGGEKVEREEFTAITFSGKEAKAKKQKDRGGRALTKLEVDFKFSNENSQMETRGSDRGARGDSRGGRRGGRGGRGRGEGRGRGRGRGDRGEGRGRGRGRGDRGRAPATQFTEADFPSL